MPYRTIQNQQQLDALLAAYPSARSRSVWRVGHVAFWSSEAATLIDSISHTGKAARRALERWWTVDEAPLP
jgi:hypothetical protein